MGIHVDDRRPLRGRVLPALPLPQARDRRQGNLGVPCQSCALVEPAGAGLVQAGPIPGLRPGASRSLASLAPVTVPSTGPSAISGPEPVIPDKPQDR